MQKYSITQSEQAFKKVKVKNRKLGNGYVLISHEAIAFIAKQLILNSSMWGSNNFSESDFLSLTVFFNHLENDLYHMSFMDFKDKRAIVRLLYSQGRYQRIPFHIIGRYYQLFKFLPNHSSNLDKMVNQVFGLNVREIMIIGISIYISLLQKGHYYPGFILNHKVSALNKILTTDKINKFVESYSISLSQFRILNSKLQFDISPLIKYEFNPLWQNPIIDTGILGAENRYLIPSTNDFIYSFTGGIFYKSMDFFRGSKSQNSFSTHFGYLFEEYVGDYISKHISVNRNHLNIVSESQYSRGKQRIDSADWLVHSENVLAQIECKKLTTSLEFRAGISSTSSSDFDSTLNTISKYVYKLYEKKNDIISRNFDLGMRETNKIYTLIVTLDELYYINTFKSEIINQLPSEKQSKLISFKFHILGCTEFEILFNFFKLAPTIDIFELFEKKESDTYYEMRFSDFLEQEYNYNAYKIDFLWNTTDSLFHSIMR